MAADLSIYKRSITQTPQIKAPTKSKPASALGNNSEDPYAALGSSPRQTMPNLYGRVQNPPSPQSTTQPSAVPQPNTQMGLLNQQQDQQEQQAYVAFQRFMNYLKMGQAAQGQQLSAGDQIQAQANYQGQLGDINSNFASLKTAAAEAERTKAETQASTAKTKAENDKSISDAELASQQDTWVSLVQNRIESTLSGFDVDETTGEYSAEDWSKVWSLYESAKDKMSENQQQMMEFYLNSLPHVQPEPEKEIDPKYRAFVDGETDTIVIDGVSYKATGKVTEYISDYRVQDGKIDYIWKGKEKQYYVFIGNKMYFLTKE